MRDRYRTKLEAIYPRPQPVEVVPEEPKAEEKPPEEEEKKPREIIEFGVAGCLDIHYSRDLVRPETLYKEPLEIGLVVGTHGSIPHVHMHLETWKRFYPEVRLLIHDDNSPDKDKLRELCGEYGCDYITTYTSDENPLSWCLGDISAFATGLLWANQHNLQILVKFSRRFIPLVSFTEGLRKLALESHYPTFNNVCTGAGYGFRTECIAMSVDTWIACKTHQVILSKISNLLHVRPVFLVEGFIHHLAEYVSAFRCKAAEDWAGNTDAFAAWDYMLTDRHKVNENYLWHMANEPKDYFHRARGLGLDYEQWSF